MYEQHVPAWEAPLSNPTSEYDNPFATVVLAHLAAQDTRRDVPGRQAVKLALVRRLYDKGYSRERVLSLFRFIDWLLALPAAAERAVDRAIAQLEEERRMPYITGIERRAIERGLEKGFEQGLQEGRQEGRQAGRLEEARRAVRRIVERRFGAMPPDLDARLARAGDLPALEALLDAAIAATALDEVQRALADEA